MKHNRNLLVPIGLAICCFGQILVRYASLPDFTAGVIQGVGLGLLLLALMGSRRKAA